jgi:hypothetical protein
MSSKFCYAQVCMQRKMIHMRGPFRTVAALLALFALSAYFAESVMASWCMSGAETSATEAMASDGHAGMHHGDGPGSDRPGSRAPDCPDGMAGAGTSCVAAPLPGTGETVRTAPISQASLLRVHVQSPDLLLISAHFRPPRA